jgi:hypothetical protein
MQKSVYLPLLLSCSLLLLSGCCGLLNDDGNNYQPQQNATFPGINSTATPAQMKEWTVMVYMDGDNDLEDAAMNDFLEMETVGSTDQMNLIVQMDRSSTAGKRYGSWATAKRFLVQKGNGQFPVTQELMDIGEVDMAGSDTLVDFVKWSTKNYPAKKYALGFWDHGAGWRGLLIDETSKSEMNMSSLRNSMYRIKQILGRNIDVVTFDMCLMGQYEVLLEIAPYADYMVASEELVPNGGLDYSATLGKLAANPAMTPKEFAISEVSTYEASYKNSEDSTTMAALDLSQAKTIEQKFTNLADAMGSDINTNWNDAADSMRYSEHYPLGLGRSSIFSFADLYDFTTLLQALYQSSSAVQYATAELQVAINSTVIQSYKHRSHPYSNGLAFYFQPSKLIYQKAQEGNYMQTKAYESAAWKSFLSAYYSMENFSSKQSEISSVSAYSSASLDKPLQFNYTIEANGIVSNSWLLFAKEGSDTVIIRRIGTRAETTLRNGRTVYGFSDGTIHASGRLSPVDIKVSDGLKSVRATIDKRWPGMDYFVVSGTLQRQNGRQEDVDVFFSENNGEYSTAYAYYHGSDGSPVLKQIVLENNDRFTPTIQVLKDNKLVEKNGQTLTFSGISPFILTWDVLQSGDYLLGVLIEDITQHQTNKVVPFSVTGQPTLTPLTAADRSTHWDCYALSAKSGSVVKYFELDMSGNGCSFYDAGGYSICSFTYSTANIPHMYLYIHRTEETLKYAASHDSQGLWLYENSGWNPYRCVLHGSVPPAKSIFP